MNGDCRSLIRLTFHYKPILFAEHQPYTCMHINESYTGSMLYCFLVTSQDIFHIFMAHPYSIIRNRNINILLLLPSPDNNPWIFILIHVSYAIIDCIFQNRLQYKLHRTKRIYLL